MPAPAQPAAAAPAVPAEPAVPAVSAAEPAAEPRTAIYIADELAEPLLDFYTYPPTACRLQHLLGERTFERLKHHGGYYPSDNHDSDGGFGHFGAVCPQPYCDTAMVWVHPDGALVVAMGLELYSNQPESSTQLPGAVQQYIADYGQQHGSEAASARVRAQQLAADPPACRTADIEQRRQRFVAAMHKQACDHEYSQFWSPAAVVPAAGDRAWFHSQAAIDTRRDGYVVAGDLVLLGWPHVEHQEFVCAEYVSIKGKRTTGWLRAADVIEIRASQQPPSRAELDALALASPASWLVAGARRSLGDLEIERGADDRVKVELAREMAGHLCGIEGRLRLVAPRVLEDVDTGCGTVGVVFNNGVYLWEDGSCSGARARCTDAYVARPAPPPG